MTDRRQPPPRRRTTDRRIADRREESRFDPDAQVRFLRADRVDSVVRGEVLDVSAAGVRIAFDELLEPGERLLIELRTSQKHCINVTAQVLWIEHVSGRCHAGCRLGVELSRRQMRVLKASIAAF